MVHHYLWHLIAVDSADCCLTDHIHQPHIFDQPLSSCYVACQCGDSQHHSNFTATSSNMDTDYARGYADANVHKCAYLYGICLAYPDRYLNLHTNAYQHSHSDADAYNYTHSNNKFGCNSSSADPGSTNEFSRSNANL